MTAISRKTTTLCLERYVIGVLLAKRYSFVLCLDLLHLLPADGHHDDIFRVCCASVRSLVSFCSSLRLVFRWSPRSFLPPSSCAARVETIWGWCPSSRDLFLICQAPSHMRRSSSPLSTITSFPTIAFIRLHWRCVRCYHRCHCVQRVLLSRRHGRSELFCCPNRVSREAPCHLCMMIPDSFTSGPASLKMIWNEGLTEESIHCIRSLDGIGLTN